MEKRTEAITVRFTKSEKEELLLSLSTYGDPAVAARMILMGFSAGHRKFKRMLWPPESHAATTSDITPELLSGILRDLEAARNKQLLAADPHGEPYTTKKKGHK